jgi:hypothetical protein
VHFIPTHASWTNLVEVWFGIVERQAIRRGVCKSVRDLNTKIWTFVDDWNDHPHPFVRTKTAHEIFKKANRPTNSDPRHEHRIRASIANPKAWICQQLDYLNVSIGYSF